MLQITPLSFPLHGTFTSLTRSCNAFRYTDVNLISACLTKKNKLNDPQCGVGESISATFLIPLCGTEWPWNAVTFYAATKEILGKCQIDSPSVIDLCC